MTAADQITQHGAEIAAARILSLIDRIVDLPTDAARLEAIAAAHRAISDVEVATWQRGERVR